MPRFGCRGMNIKTPLITTIALALVAGAPAAAHDNHDLPRPGNPAHAVPAGKIEHTVTVTQVSGSKARPSHMRHELWMTRKRARAVTTDVKTGKVTFEMVITPSETRTYSAQTRRVTVQKTRRASIPYNSWLFDAAVQQAYVHQGITKVIGQTMVRGNPALIVESVPGKWTSDRPDGRTVAVVDAVSYGVYERTSTLPNGEFTQKDTVEVQEYLSPSPRVSFAMGKHQGANVRPISR